MSHGQGVLNGKKLMKCFDYAQIVIDGKPLRALRIVCAKCGKTEVVRVNTMSGAREGMDTKEHQFAARRFSEMGWEVGANSSRHRCPGCAVTDEKQGETSMALNITPLPVRQMTREDRRIIFEKLNEVYLDEKHGYSDDWTDKKVANDLGVPQAWVAQIRDENFGSIGTNASIDDDLAKISQHIEEMRKVAKALNERADTLERKMVDIRKAVRP